MWDCIVLSVWEKVEDGCLVLKENTHGNVSLLQVCVQVRVRLKQYLSTDDDSLKAWCVCLGVSAHVCSLVTVCMCVCVSLLLIVLDFRGPSVSCFLSEAVG